MSAEATKHFSVADELQDSTKAVRQGEELDLARLEPYLRSHFPDLGGDLAVKQFPSGHSNLTYSVALGKGNGIRRPPSAQGEVRARYGPRIQRAAKTTQRVSNAATTTVLH